MTEFLTGLGFNLTTHGGIFWFSCVWIFAVVSLIWLIGLFQGNHSMMDGFYGFGYATTGWIAFWLTDANSLYAGLLFLMVSLHGCRLGYYLSKRWAGYRKTTGGDARYLGFVEKFKPGYWWKSFFIVMQPQTIVIMVIGLPATYGIMDNAHVDTPMNWLALLGMLVFGIGTYYEWISDGQLQAFKQDPEHKGRYLEHGVWALTRHPNYFGNTTVWWGIWLVAVAGNPSTWWTVAGPLFNTIMLTRILGKAFQDNYMGSRPEYQALISRSSGFLPRFRK